jgi:hypothetical protein
MGIEGAALHPGGGGGGGKDAMMIVFDGGSLSLSRVDVVRKKVASNHVWADMNCWTCATAAVRDGRANQK